MDEPRPNYPPHQDCASTPDFTPEQGDPSSHQNGPGPNPTSITDYLTDGVDPKTLQDLIQREAERLPDVRQDRIKQIREALKSRKYHLSSAHLADRIIKDVLLDESSTQD